MQKILNDPDSFVSESLEGILLAHPSELRRVSARGVVRVSAPIRDKVGIATGGGYGHLPVFLGYVGDGLADGAAVGNVFASPSADEMLNVTRAVHGGAGVLYVYGNYGGDVMNFELAADLAREEGIEVAAVLARDDVASAPRADAARRRGIAGIFFLYKVAGALARQGADLQEVRSVTQRAADQVASIGIALAPCTVPAAGVPTFELPAGQMEVGMGIHGEPGVRRGPLERADVIADEFVEAVVADLGLRSGDTVSVLVNGLGATPKEELYILYRRIHRDFATAGLDIHRAYVGEFATSLEMAGASLSVIRLDEEIARLVDAPAQSPFFVQQ